MSELQDKLHPENIDSQTVIFSIQPGTKMIIKFSGSNQTTSIPIGYDDFETEAGGFVTFKFSQTDITADITAGKGRFTGTPKGGFISSI